MLAGVSLNSRTVIFSFTKAFSTGISLAWQGSAVQTWHFPGQPAPIGNKQLSRQASSRTQRLPLRQHLQVHGSKSAGVPGGVRASLEVCERRSDRREQEPPQPAVGKPIQDTFDLSSCSFLGVTIPMR